MYSIGSSFELNRELFKRKENKSFPWDANKKYIKYFNTGRSAIRYLFSYVIDSTEKKILIPAYLCKSIIQALDDVKVKYEFYNIDENLNIDIRDLKRKINKNTSAVFFIQYFGFNQKREIIDFLKNLNITLIEDLTQSIFSNNELLGVGDYIIVSLRKWIEVPDGALLLSNKNFKNIDIEKSDENFISNSLTGQFLKSIELDNKVNFNSRRYILNAEEIIDKKDKKIRNISNISTNIIKKYDFNMLLKRKENYKYLEKELRKIIDIKVMYKNNEDIIPLGMIVKTKNRNDLLSYLISKKIYCPIHWKIEKEIADNYPNLKKLSDEILTIPCDQRYGLKEMKIISEVINQFYLNEDINV